MYLNTQIKGITTLIGLLVLLHSCSRFDLDDYIFDDLPAKTEAQLQSMADTSLTLSRIVELSKRRQIDSLIFYAEWLKNYDEDMAIWYAEQAYDLATEKNWNIPRGVSANRIATIKGWKAEYGEAIEDAMVDARISKRLLSAYDNAYWEVDLNNLFGFLHKRDNELDSARHYFEIALKRVGQIKSNKKLLDRDKAIIMHNLATTYPMSDSLSKINLYQKSDSIYRELDNQENRARLWLDWGIFFRIKKEFELADSLFTLCVEYGKKNQDFNQLAFALHERGVLNLNKYFNHKEITAFHQAHSDLKESLKYNPDNAYRTYEAIGNNFQNGWFYYLDDSHIDSAILYYKGAMEKASQAGAIRTMDKLSSDLAYLCNFMGEDHAKILGKGYEDFLDQHYGEVVDTLTNHTRIAYQRINKVEQRDIQVSESNKRQNLLFMGLGVFFVAVTIFVFSLQRQQNRRLKAEMEALRAQINPHFISNSLNAIESLVNLGNTKAASKYLVHFSRLSRQILTGSRTSITSLSDELKTLKHFLALEQLRFKDKLTYDIHVEPDVKSDAVQVPAMILQPYAENAIWHGIKPKPEGGHVQVNVSKKDKVLVCSVEDNGVGREKSKALKEASVMKHKSMGMKITEDRIKAMGRVKGSQVEIQDLKDEAGEAAGTRVIIRLPYKLK